MSIIGLPKIGSPGLLTPHQNIVSPLVLDRENPFTWGLLAAFIPGYEGVTGKGTVSFEQPPRCPEKSWGRGIHMYGSYWNGMGDWNPMSGKDCEIMLEVVATDAGSSSSDWFFVIGHYVSGADQSGTWVGITGTGAGTFKLAIRENGATYTADTGVVPVAGRPYLIRVISKASGNSYMSVHDARDKSGAVLGSAFATGATRRDIAAPLIKLGRDAGGSRRQGVRWCYIWDQNKVPPQASGGFAITYFTAMRTDPFQIWKPANDHLWLPIPAGGAVSVSRRRGG